MKQVIISAFAVLLPLTAVAQTVEQAKTEFNAAHYAKARALLQHILSTEPRNAHALYFLGRVKLAQHELAESVDALEAAVAIDEKRPEFHIWAGRAIGEQTRSANIFRQPALASRSKAHLERAVALAPADIEARKALSEFYAIAPEFLGGGKARAREQAAEIKKLNAYEGYLQMAWVLADGNDPAGAAQELIAARRIYPESAAVVHALSDLYLRRLRRPADGATLEVAYAAAHPKDSVAFFYLGRSSAISGLNVDMGEKALQQYLNYSPRYGEPSLAAAHFRLGGLAARRGEKSIARREYELALQLDSTLVPARSALNALGN